MVHLQKAKMLYQLYHYRALGYEYIEETKATHEATKFSSALPQSITQMQPLVESCHLCSLAKTRKNVVFGEGNLQADIMFIGEGPGANEDELGRPFVGRAGEILTKIITNVLNLKREDVYIANIVKCRPPNNRVPTIEEVDACKEYILQQIKIVKPKIIVALGSTSYHHLTGQFDTKISQIRGEVMNFGDAKLVPTYHPSFLLRNPSAKREVFQDMLRVKELMS